MKIYYTPEALKDLQELKIYIVQEFSDMEVAGNVIKDITGAIRNLELFPSMGTDLSIEISAGSGYRYLFCRQNYIFYRIENDTIRIVRILNEKREFIRILFGTTEE